MALRNLITTNIKESFVPANKNSITGFCIVGHIALMDYIRTNYGTVTPKKLQDNEIALDAQCDPTTPIAVLFTPIEDCKLFNESGEEPLTEKISFALHTFPSKTLDCSTCPIIPVKKIPQAPKI